MKSDCQRRAENMRKATVAGRPFVDKRKKVSALPTTDETPSVASVDVAPDFDGYLYVVTTDSSWNETLCTLMRPPTALARRRANATPMSGGLSVFLLIDSGSAVTGCPRDWCPNIPLREMKQLRSQAAGENQTIEHCGEKDMLFTTAGHKSMEFNFQVCNVRFSIVSVYRLTQAGCKLEKNDSMAQLRLTEKVTLDLDLIGGTLWLELWDPRPFVHGANTLICLVSHGNSCGSRLETVSEDGENGDYKFTYWNGRNWQVAYRSQTVGCG